MSAIDYTDVKCPKCFRSIRVPAKERDINYVFCPGIQCAFYFDIGGNVLPDSIVAEMPDVENHRMTFAADQLHKLLTPPPTAERIYE